jgi:cytochrome bd-type quinol oxidase subunit 1
MSNWRILYWLLVGALFGFGVISILSIGIFVLAAGLVLLIYGAIRFGGGRMWAALIGFGVAPAALLLWDVTAQPWACEPTNHTTYSPIVQAGQTYTSPNYFTCVNTPVGPLTTYHVLAAIFGVIALAGLLIGLLALLWDGRRRGRPGHAAA